MASVDTDISGEGSIAFDAAGYVDHVTIHLETAGAVATVYGTVEPLRVVRAGWWAFGASFPENDDVVRFYCGRIMWIDFMDQVFNGEPLNRYWDSIRWSLQPGVTGHLWVVAGGPG